ncbi:MAG TPA: NADH-quinone oxidoreductase subunit C, partial [Ktedonobacterales bacterium]
MINNMSQEHDPGDDALRQPISQQNTAHDGNQGHDRSGIPAHATPASPLPQLEAVLAAIDASSPQDAGRGGAAVAEVRLTVDAETLAGVVPAMHEQGIAYFAHLFADKATSEGGEGDETEIETERTNTVGNVVTLHALMALAHRPALLHLMATLPAGVGSYPSLAPLLPAAGWYERELHEETGIIAEGHPRLMRLRLPAEWPAEVHPLEGDMPDVLEVSDQDGEESGEARVPLVGLDDERAVLDPGPEGVVDYPLGPVRSGVVESAHYMLRTVGEEIVDARLQLFFKHRGVEHRAIGLTPFHLPLLAERISGMSGFSHALAACQALERAGGV